jgi:hypothetical protein
MTDQPAPDWEELFRRYQAAGVAELDLTSIKAGDTLLVVTKHTAYCFSMLGRSEALMVSNRPDRPAGKVRINGCTFGRSSSIKPDHLFCGGNLEFVHGTTHRIYTTSEITGLQLTQADKAPA